MSTPPSAQADYPLGYSQIEDERLARQARRHNAVTERLFREAGLAQGHHVVEIGSGLGHVSALIAAIVGPTGSVVGIERDAASIQKAEQNMRAAGVHNVRFVHGDLHDLTLDDRFDALAGRFVLMFLPDPAAAVRSLARYVRPGGIIAFNEVCWTPFLAFAKPFPLRCALARVCHEAMLCAHADPDMGLGLRRTFIDAGLPPPAMRLEMILGVDEDLSRWLYDIFLSLRPKIAEHGIATDALGNPDTLLERLQKEILSSNSVISSVGIVGAWTTKP